MVFDPAVFDPAVFHTPSDESGDTLINSIVAAIVGKAGNIAGMRGTSPKAPDTIGPTPYTIVGPHTAELLPGSWEKYTLTFPMWCYVARTKDDVRSLDTVNDLADAFRVEFRSDVQLAGTVAQSIVTGWDTTQAATIGGSDYWVLEVRVEVIVAQGRTYTA